MAHDAQLKTTMKKKNSRKAKRVTRTMFWENINSVIIFSEIIFKRVSNNLLPF